MTPLASYAHRYRSELLDRVIPFWLRHSLDPHHGGYFTCLTRDGAVYDSRKYVWLQGRAVWMFSKLYNDLEPRQEFLDAARLILDFLRRHARDPVAPGSLKNNDVYPPRDGVGWSENVARQLSVPERFGFGAYLKTKGFDLA